MIEIVADVVPAERQHRKRVAPHFADLATNTAKQLHQVAKLIEARGITGANRQIFFVQLGGFVTGEKMKERALAIAKGVSGVKQVDDALFVKPE